MPERWANIKRLTMQAKLNIAPLQALENVNIQKKAKRFEAEQYQFREVFKKACPFEYNIKNPYEMLNNVKRVLFLNFF